MNALHEHVDAAAFTPPDLTAIHAQGHRALRRRRAGLVGAGFVAASLVIAAITLAVVAGPDNAGGKIPVARDPGAGGPEVVWVEGATLHSTATGETDLGRRAVALVRTSAGAVFADEAGAIFAVAAGEVTQVGSTNPEAIRLVSDPAGPRAVWLDEEGTRIVSYDQATGADLVLDKRITDPGARLTALDGDTAYVSVGQEARSVNLVNGVVRVVAEDGSEVLDAADSLLALGSDSGIRLSGPGPATVLRDDYGDVGTFSPDGAWFSSDADDPRVVDVATGDRATFDAPGFFATGYEWLDATTLVMIAQQSEAAPFELLTCQLPAGTCRPVAELGTYEQIAERGLVLPVGLPEDL